MCLEESFWVGFGGITAPHSQLCSHLLSGGKSFPESSVDLVSLLTENDLSAKVSDLKQSRRGPTVYLDGEL